MVPVEPSPLPTSSMHEAPTECGELKRMALSATRSSSYTAGEEGGRTHQWAQDRPMGMMIKIQDSDGVRGEEGLAVSVSQSRL